MGRGDDVLCDRVASEPGVGTDHKLGGLHSGSICQQGNLVQRVRYHERFSQRDYRMDTRGVVNVPSESRVLTQTLISESTEITGTSQK